MKLADALAFIAKSNMRGYRVSFEIRDGMGLLSDHFPERDEEPYKTEAEAWMAAHHFAKVNPGKYVNIYVTHSDDFSPVPNYRVRILNEYPKPRGTGPACGAGMD